MKYLASVGRLGSAAGVSFETAIINIADPMVIGTTGRNPSTRRPAGPRVAISMAPSVSALVDHGDIEGRAVKQLETFEAAVKFSKAEGIIPAPESAHAIAVAMQEALAFARNDPELRRWLDDMEAADRAIVAKFHELRAPATLRQQILDGLAVSTSRQPRRVARPLALTLASLAAAASVALAIYTAVGGRRPVQSFDRLVATAVTETREQPSLSFHASACSRPPPPINSTFNAVKLLENRAPA